MNKEEEKAINNLINILEIHHISSKPVQQLLDLYNKQQEEIETLKEVDKKICNEELLTQEYVQNNYISKDKIRDKIKELEWYGEYIKYRFVYTDYDKEVNKVKIETLKELLEEQL